VENKESTDVCECPIEDPETYPCTESTKRILAMLEEQKSLIEGQQSQIDEHTKILQGLARTVNETHANMSQVVDSQRRIVQHISNLEARYASLDCLRPKTPSSELRALRAVDTAEDAVDSDVDTVVVEEPKAEGQVG